MTETITFLLAGTILAGTPLLIAALGELIAEKSGVLNLSVEGMMAVGAAAGFIAVKLTGSYWLGFLVGGLSASLLSAVFAFVVLITLGNQVAAGIAIGILGIGLAGLIGHPYESSTISPMATMDIPLLSQIPVIGPGLFSHTPLAYLAVVLVFLTAWVLKSTALGRTIRAVGEDPHAANSIGYDVVLVRFFCVLYGGFMAGVAGAFISTVSATLWSDGIIAGRGWIVVALVVFGTWRAGRIAIGAYLFGFANLAGLLVQSTGVAIPSQFLTSVPYIITIIAISLLSMNPARLRLNTPVTLGQTYLETK